MAKNGFAFWNGRGDREGRSARWRFLQFVLIILAFWVLSLILGREHTTIYTQRCDVAWGIPPGPFQPERREAIYLVHANTGDPVGYFRDWFELEKFYVWPGWIAETSSQYDLEQLCRSTATRVTIRGWRWMKGVPGYRRVITQVY